MCCTQELHFTSVDIDRLRVRGWREIEQANTNQNKAGAARFISDNAHVRTMKSWKTGCFLFKIGKEARVSPLTNPI